MEYRIMYKKLSFLNHIANLNMESLANEVYREQRRLRLPGLVSECQQMLATLIISEQQITKLNKMQWKRLIKSRINERNKETLLEMMKTMKKMNYRELREEEFEKKSYLSNMNVSDTRQLFAIKSKMTRGTMMNYQEKFSRVTGM